LEKALMDKFNIDHPTFQLEADLSNEKNKVVNIQNNLDDIE
jgi:hypothetical protein